MLNNKKRKQNEGWSRFELANTKKVSDSFFGFILDWIRRFIFIIGLGFAIIFPLIFSITVDAMPDRTNEVSGLMVTVIIGRTIIPVLFGIIADLFAYCMF